jgi:hypothetical protein
VNIDKFRAENRNTVFRRNVQAISLTDDKRGAGRAAHGAEEREDHEFLKTAPFVIVLIDPRPEIMD